MIKMIFLYLMAVFYVFAGVMHFVRPEFYLKMMPPILPQPLALVYLSGVAEAVLGGMLFIPSLRVYAAWGVIALLLAVFPANIYMYQKGGAAFGVSDMALLVRLPIQLLLVYWAYVYTRV